MPMYAWVEPRIKPSMNSLITCESKWRMAHICRYMRRSCSRGSGSAGESTAMATPLIDRSARRGAPRSTHGAERTLRQEDIRLLQDVAYAGEKRGRRGPV